MIFVGSPWVVLQNGASWSWVQGYDSPMISLYFPYTNHSREKASLPSSGGSSLYRWVDVCVEYVSTWTVQVYGKCRYTVAHVWVICVGAYVWVMSMVNPLLVVRGIFQDWLASACQRFMNIWERVAKMTVTVSLLCEQESWAQLLCSLLYTGLRNKIQVGEIF